VNLASTAAWSAPGIRRLQCSKGGVLLTRTWPSTWRRTTSGQRLCPGMTLTPMARDIFLNRAAECGQLDEIAEAGLKGTPQPVWPPEEMAHAPVPGSRLLLHDWLPLVIDALHGQVTRSRKHPASHRRRKRRRSRKGALLLFGRVIVRRISSRHN